MNTATKEKAFAEKIAGCLLGCAVGDAIGLPYEGLSARRSRKFAKLPLRHRFIFGRGMVSDDTDHTVFVAQSLVCSAGDVARFRRCLAWRLRFWLLSLPAGIGKATLCSIIKLWLGFRNSGVYSAGNGPSMRSAIIGAAYADNKKVRHEHVVASTLLTHTDPKALAGALAVAEIAARLAGGIWHERPAANVLAQTLADVSTDSDWLMTIERLRELCESDADLALAAERLGGKGGVSGYTLHSVPFAIWAWYRHFGDFRATIETITQAGGDVDTVAAIAGALSSITVGTDGIPDDWRKNLADWPHSRIYLGELAAALAGANTTTSTRFSPWLFPRSIVFMAIVLAHGFRRLLPPY